MFQIKSQSNFIKIFVVLLLALFVAGSSFSMLHAFSHHTSVVENSSNDKNPEQKSTHCLFCFFSNFQNHINLTPQLFFCVAAFYLAFISREFDRVKLSYLLSSNAPRAPPVIS